MVASDIRILELIVSKQLEVWPFVYSNVQPSSLDLTLDEKIKIPKAGIKINPSQGVTETQYDICSISDGEYELLPNEMILAQVHEKLKIPENYCCSVMNRSSISRLGLDVAMAGYINPGYAGQLPIIIRNNGSFSVKLLPGLRICQLVLHKVEPTPLRDYSQRKDVKYMGESDSLISKLHLDEELRICVKKAGGKDASSSDFIQELVSYWKALAAGDYEEFNAKLDDSIKKDLGLL
ncbi:MAG: dCTP deaminase [Synergistaceae bacterium]|nr:dCTP deaminase [Synergistaceae bacterium]